MRKSSKNNIKLLLILIIVLAFIPYKLIFSKADENVNDNKVEENIIVETDAEGGQISKLNAGQEEFGSNENNEGENKVLENTVFDLTNIVENTVVNNTVASNTVDENDDGNKINENKVNSNSVDNTVFETEKPEENENKVSTNEISNTIEILDENIVENENLTLGATLEDVVEEKAVPEIGIQATLWDTNQYSGGTGTVLTDVGATINNWQFETNKYLQIDPTVPADGNTYIVRVELPQEFYIVGTELALPTGYQNVDFTKNEEIIINASTKYELQPYSGNVEYTLNNMGVSGTIQLGIGYDSVLWDKQANSSLTPEGVNPITVKLLRKESDGTVNELNKIFISKAFAGEKNQDSASVGVMLEGESSSASTMIANSDSRIKFVKSINNNDGMVRYKYYKSARITIKLPSYKDANGNTYYLNFDQSTLNMSKVAYTSINVDMSQKDSGIITIDLENPYWNSGTLISGVLGPLPDELLDLEQNSFVFKNGTVTTVVNGKNGNNNITYRSCSIPNIEYQKNSLEDVVISSQNKTVTIVERPSDAISIFGGIYLENKGTGVSCPKNINLTFDIENTNIIKVTTINTFADTIQDYIDITYTLVDENGQRVYLDASGNRVSEGSSDAVGEWVYSIKNSCKNSTAKANLKNTITRNQLPESHRQYYFKSINYTLESINEQTRLYAPSSVFTLSAAGNFLGYVDGDAGSKAISKMVVTSANTTIPDLERTVTTTLQNTSTPTYIIDNAEISKTKIQAGESFNISGKVATPTYPYGNSTWLKRITLAVKLPKDITINEQAIILKNAKGQLIVGSTVTTQDLGDGNILWRIKLPEDIYIGRASESLGTLPSGDTITFNLQLDTSYTMNALTIFVKDVITVGGYKQVNNASGSYSWASKPDIYDINENGSTTDNIGGLKTSNTSACQIISQTATLDIQDSITVESNGNVSEESSTANMFSMNDIINYNLDIGCFSGGRAEGFVYYIPIPKKTAVTDNFLIENSQNGKFELELSEEPTYTGNNIFDLSYVMEEGITYASAANVEKWYTAEEINNESSLKFEDVTMIKLTVRESVIRNGDKSRITLKLKYVGDTFNEEAGKENIWHSGGYYKFINSDRESAGNFATEGVSVKLNCADIELDEITLTAARGMTPTGIGNVNVVNIPESEFPVFENAHTFKITDVETYNVILQTKDYMIANPDMPGIEANNNFAITVMMDDNEKNILESAKENPIEVGKILSNSSPSFTYKIYNADALNDNSQIRYIIVTLESENGLILKQKININSEVVQASDPQMAIVAGKRYVTYDDTSTIIGMSQDSAFTAQFILEYIPNTYKDERITFSSALPVGTKIILENFTDAENPTYWYYSVNSSVSTIKLEDFVAMGRIGSDNYDMPNDMDIIKEKLLVIVDFSQCTNCLSAATYSIRLQLTGANADVEDFSSSELKYTLKNKNTFLLNEISNAKMGENFTVNYTMSLTQGADTKYGGRKASLVVTAPDNIPSDTMLTVQNNVYNLNSEKQYIISLGDIKTQTNSLQMNLFSNMQPETETTYEFEVALWISATANADAPKLGELIGSKKINITTNNQLNPALKVTGISSRIIKKNELNQTYTVNYKYIPDENCKVTFELQQKIGTAYKKVTDKLNQVNGSTTHTMGTFDITPNVGDNTLEFKLSSITEKSTYRVVFKVYDDSGTVIAEVPYNFLVLDK